MNILKISPLKKTISQLDCKILSMQEAKSFKLKALVKALITILGNVSGIGYDLYRTAYS
ncbi:MAG: hypothetical protein MJA82_20660 [Clostridia bacterium]|nr:hypothetical protein [Clostridia bacterium]